MRQLFLYISIVFLFSSCFKEEEKREPITFAFETIDIKSDYSLQYYFNLENKQIVSSNKWNIWDLAFYSKDDDHYVKLNHAANMKAYDTESLDFDGIKKFNESWNSEVDNPTGKRNEIALNIKFYSNNDNDTLFSKQHVYVLLVGSDYKGNKLGYKKVIFEYIYKTNYHIRYANIDGTEEYTKTITKDDKLNFVSFSFKNYGEIINVEPDKTTWDLLFTRSTDVVYRESPIDTIWDYSVTSVLLNPYYTNAYLDEKTMYNDLKSNEINSTKLSNKINTIGYSWKKYDIDGGNSGEYNVSENKTYVIKDDNSYFYKLKFLSFLDPKTNERGSISFQYEIIK